MYGLPRKAGSGAAVLARQIFQSSRQIPADLGGCRAQFVREIQLYLARHLARDLVQRKLLDRTRPCVPRGGHAPVPVPRGGSSPSGTCAPKHEHEELPVVGMRSGCDRDTTGNRPSGLDRRSVGCCNRYPKKMAGTPVAATSSEEDRIASVAGEVVDGHGEDDADHVADEEGKDEVDPAEVRHALARRGEDERGSARLKELDNAKIRNSHRHSHRHSHRLLGAAQPGGLGHPLGVLRPAMRPAVPPQPQPGGLRHPLECCGQL